MLVIILCRFSVPIGKYFFKINHSHLHPYLYREWLKPLHKFVAATPATSEWCNLLNLEYKKAIASGTGTKTAVKSWYKSVSVKSKLVKIETKTAWGSILHSFKPPSMLVS